MGDEGTGMAVVPKQDGLDILRKLVPLNTLSDEMLAELVDAVTFEKIAKGRYLLREGDTDPERVYLLSGSLGLVEDGREVDSVAANSNMARYPIAQHIPRRYSVKTKSKAEVVRIDGRLLNDLLARGGSGIYQVQELDPEADNDWMGQLLQSPIFQRIPAANIQNIMMRMEELQVSSGEMIIRQGEDGDYFFLINQGQCAVTRENPTGDIEEVARLRAGECFGEESLLSGRPRSSTVCMLTDGVLFRLPKSDFVEYIKLPLANAISYQDAQRKIGKGAVWLDVRSPLEHARASIPDSRNIPFNELRRQAPGLESEQSYVVYCQDGLVSSTAVYLLMEQGLDAYVLERGLESVPVDDLDQEEQEPDGAQVISLHPEPESQSAPAPVPDDEAGLLRERLQKTEAQAQEQMQRGRKMKLMLEKLKGRLVEAEQAGGRDQEVRQQLNGEIDQLRSELKARESTAGSLQQQQEQLAARLKEMALERNRIEGELDEVRRQVGQLESREQEASRRARSLDHERNSLQQALDEAGAVLQQQQSVQDALREKEKKLQLSLQQANAEAGALQAQLAAREVAAGEAVQAAERHAQAQATTLRTDLQQARERVEVLEATLAEQGSSEEQRSRQLLAAEKQQQLLNGELKQLRGELERVSGEVGHLESELREAEQNHKRQRLELESSHKSSLQEVQEARRAAEAAQRSAGNERDRISAELAVLQAHYGQLQKTLQERDHNLAELRQGGDEVVRLNELLEQVRSELKDARESAESSRQELETLRQQAQGAQANAVVQDAEQQALEQQLASLQATHEQLVAERQVLDEERSAREAALHEASRKLAQMESITLQEQERREQLEQTLDQQRAEVERLKQAMPGAPAGDDIKILQAELTTLNAALDEADRSYEQLERERNELKAALEARQQASTGVEPERQAGTEVQRLTSELAALAGELARERERAATELARLQTELEAAQASAEESSAGVSADSVMETLQQELQEARNRLKELELSSSADAAEGEVLRQEIDKLRRSLEERTTELEKTRREGLQLEEKTEERNSEIDHLKLALEAAQVDADEAQFKRDEALDARKQVEEALYQLQKQVERERTRDDLLQRSRAATDDTPLLPMGGGKGRVVLALLAAALLAFAVADGIAIISGKGELLSGLLDSRQAPAVILPGGGVPAIEQRGSVSSSASAESVGPMVSDAPVAAEKQPDAVVTKATPEESKTEPESPPASASPSEPDPAITTAPALSSLPLAPRIVPTPRQLQRSVPAAAQARSSEPETGSLIQDSLSSGGRGPEMLYIRGGSFQMGSNIFLSREEQPVHQVRLPSFSIGRYEVTFREYGLFAATTGRDLPDDLGWGQGSRPVINVSWEDAAAYAEWLSAETGRHYRLPSEAEWEYAAGAGSDTPYWWGFDLGREHANCFNCGSQWDGVSTAPVGRFEANPFGLHNTAGNVMEWVSDCYHNSYAGAPTDGSSWQQAECGERVVRGGAFNKPGDSLRITRRNHHSPDTRLFALGFRVVREVN